MPTMHFPGSSLVSGAAPDTIAGLATHIRPPTTPRYGYVSNSGIVEFGRTPKQACAKALDGIEKGKSTAYVDCAD